jgi:hypothetical protein
MNIYHDTIPYLYKWTHLPSGKWYIGSKARKGWNPTRHEEYICSSKIVKPMIIENRSEWCYDILCIGDSEYIVELERLILKYLNAKDDPMSFNQHNGDGLFNRSGVRESKETREKKKLAHLGEKGSMYGKKGPLCPHYGKKHSEERRKNQSTGVKKYAENRPQSHNDNISKALLGNPKLSEAVKGEKNPMFGIPASEYNKAMTKLKNSGDGNPMRNPKYQMTCPHCKRSFAKSNYNMWHGDKCKNKLDSLKQDN